jgi:endonuclease/exonuclease/phosphatase family metal-dependent hydrolase
VSESATRPAPSLRVVQLNIGSLLEPDWKNRRYEIVSWLDHLEPDVVCLEEVWARVGSSDDSTAHWLAGHLATPPTGTWHVAFGGGEFDDSLWPDAGVLFGSAVLSRWPIDDQHHWPLPVVADDDPFPSQVPWELVHARTAGLDLFACHLASAPVHGHHRHAQVLAIDEHIRSIRAAIDGPGAGRGPRAEMPAILCGDFNAEPESDEMRFLTSLCDLDGRRTYYQDAWKVAGDGSDGWTQDWRTHPFAASLNVPRKRIDYVLVGDPFSRVDGAGRVLHAELAFHRSRTGVMASDHIGLSVDVLWPQRPR